MTKLPLDELSEEERALANGGRYVELAERLADRPALAGVVLERVWDFAGAADAYATAGRWVDAVRAAVEAERPDLVDAAVDALTERAIATELDAAVEVLGARGRHAEVARLHVAREDAAASAEALERAGDPLGAARAHLERADPRAALEALGTLREVEGAAAQFAVAAEAAWLLGDLEAAARFGQATLRTLDRHGDVELESAIRPLLARALESLGHPTAAEIVLAGGTADHERHRALGEDARGRYQVLAHRHTSLPGAAYVALDRVTHQEVDVQLLFGEEEVEPEVRDAVRRFIERANAAASTRHPALRPMLTSDAEQGLLVLERSDGPTLRRLIRAPGMSAARARAMALFLLDGLASLHHRGVVHGGVLPHLIRTDSAGRPRLGPAGFDLLDGLAATRTGALDELLVLTPPERLRGAPASAAGDVYAVGRLLLALISGTLEPDPELAARQLATLGDAAETVSVMLDADPLRRPDAADARDALTARVGDLRELGETLRDASTSGVHAAAAGDDGVTAVVPPSFSQADLDDLCSAADPWTQPILKRDGRALTLSAWPQPTRPARADAQLDPRALASLAPPLADRIRQRGSTVLVQTATGETMVSLERLFAPA